VSNAWQYKTVYQIYPRSFNDTTGSGTGDLNGIIEKLDYLKTLGIGLIWLSPIYRSPMADNGYDISDYEDIAPEFGTMAAFDALLSEAKRRDIGILMDLVVNHTSDEHPWFMNARSSRNATYRDYYIWRDPAADGGAPNSLQSYFGGSAWSFCEATGQYYLHLFDRKQPDLNWKNPQLRAAIYRMMNNWLDRGIAGFRMDVIDLIGKEVDQGITADGPHLHSYIKEMHQACLAGRDVVTVGEAWSASPDSALLYSGRQSQELSMVFQFEHVSQQWDDTLGKWAPKAFDLKALKRVLNKWQAALSDDGWNSLFWGNHDLPRAVSKYGNDSEYRVESAKMLATLLHFMRGTPYIYQGEELGMTNAQFQSFEQLRDVEAINFFHIQTQAGVSEADFMVGANANGRDNARTPMHWSNEANAGFTSGIPWIEINPNYTDINAAACLTDPDSVFHHYRKLCELRAGSDLIVHGNYQPLFSEHPQLFAYLREHLNTRVLVVANFFQTPLEIDWPKELQGTGKTLITNYSGFTVLGSTLALKPYECFAFELETGVYD